MKINIGDRLKRLRLEKGLTQEELAGVFGVSAQAISRWENNTSYPDITLLPQLAEVSVSEDARIAIEALGDVPFTTLYE